MSGGQNEARQVFGNNRVFCGGRFVSGPDVRSSFISVVMIVLPSCLWHAEVGEFWSARHESMSMGAVAICLQVLSTVMLFATAFSDPGIMPRQQAYDSAFDMATKKHRQKQPPRYHDTMIRGVPFRLKYCVTCHIYRPPRCTHCAVCENCIERFDHHCPWLGNCIGKRNYWLFFCFVLSTACLNVYVLATSLAQIVRLAEEIIAVEAVSTCAALVNVIFEAPIAIILVVYSIAIVWFTCGLCFYHVYLVSTNQTTYEQIKGAYSGQANPFHRGILGNFKDVLCSRVRPRYFDASTGELRRSGPPAPMAPLIEPPPLAPLASGQATATAPFTSPCTADAKGVQEVRPREENEVPGQSGGMTKEDGAVQDARIVKPVSPSGILLQTHPDVQGEVPAPPVTYRAGL
eukprot:TRINITY_DN26469_c0_g1_i1.p1 TRINITY_DN26469_c0_g1~~TRINITY_DN26469_c0_g1_i1.p1  ORF type:complete len:403 (+),score=43.91 TRINITY_DN26469_c0_g1_i1:134-1342(+)